ncbi:MULTISPECIES: hypothetical protein [Bradyrhizobium]|uniref:hypothetical protein n=1 Tax=Bradyrhizobium TaxID=374 RepID=UPI001FEB86AF|nr:hypothetical protein [Bradyrhizobium liaoningense]
MARTSGRAAHLLRAGDRRFDVDSMVVGFGAPSPSDQASTPSDSIQPSLGCELNSRAIDALRRAREMPSGDKRMAAMRRAAILGNAVEIHAYFSATKAPKQDQLTAEIPPS